MKPVIKNIALVIIPLGIYIFYSSFLKNWIIDDAGISFAYARNLANGYGLTSWPGEKPVEGFSNFLWTCLIAILHILQLFDPTITPKILSAIFMTCTFIMINQIFIKITKGKLYGLAANIFIAFNAPIVIWTNSGMENSLYIFLLILLCKHIIEFGENSNYKQIFCLSVVCFLIALTRPEGCLYFFALPTVIVVSRIRYRSMVMKILMYGFYFILLFGGFLSFRFLYFGDILPNPYYAKYNALLSENIFLEKLVYLTYGAGDRWARVLILLNCIAIPFSFIYSGELKKICKILVILFCLGTLNFFILPSDWMGELRFASPFIVFNYLLLIFQFYVFFKTFANKSDLKRYVSASLLLALIVYSGYYFYLRTKKFSLNPTVSFANIKNKYTYHFDEYAELFKLENATILYPDLGATLYYSHLKIYDAAGLCDKTVAINLGTNEKILHDYLFETLQPTFIHLHGHWSYLWQLESDSRFNRDYAVIIKNPESIQVNGEVKTVFSGDYVRKEDIKGVKFFQEPGN